jgi:hypothetical protein
MRVVEVDGGMCGVPFCPGWIADRAMGCDVRVQFARRNCWASSTLRFGATVQAWLVHCTTEYLQVTRARLENSDGGTVPADPRSFVRYVSIYRLLAQRNESVLKLGRLLSARLLPYADLLRYGILELPLGLLPVCVTKR